MRGEAPTVSVVIPAYDEEAGIGGTLEELTGWLRGTGLSWEVLVVDDGSKDRTREAVEKFSSRDRRVHLLAQATNQGKGAAVRRGVLESRGDVVVFLDADLPYDLANVEHVVAQVKSGATDIAIGGRDLPESDLDRSYPLLRRIMGRSFSGIVQALLVPGIPDTQCGLKAFSAHTARVLFSESRLKGFGFDFEILFLARKYGFRIERVPVGMSHRHESKVRLMADSFRMFADVLRVRYWNRAQAYRPPRRCPVCFSSEVSTRTQIRGWVVRQCFRCKCRYLASFPSDDELETLYNESYFSSHRDTEHGYASRELTPATARTGEKRLSVLRRHLPPRARILEVGAGNGLFGRLAAKEFDYVGIDLSEEAVRAARSEGLQIIRSSLSHFVNTGSLFDAVTLFHVFEHLNDPHDSLARISDLLKPNGILILITPDTESALCALSGDSWVSYKFPEHLILYSRSALIELLEHSGFEIVSVSSDFEYCTREFVESRLSSLHPVVGGLARAAMVAMPDPMPTPSGSIRLVVRRRSGSNLNVRAIRAVEPTHAR